MFRVVILVLAVAARISAEEDIPLDDISEEDGVLVLNTTNFEGAVYQNKFVLVEFYAPWCGNCKTLAPEYSKAANKLKEEGSDIKLAKVDATVEIRLANKFQIRNYPTLKFFKNGSPVEFTGGAKSDDIVNWLKKKTGSPATVLNNKDEVAAFKDEAGVVIIGFFKDQQSDGAKEFLAVASDIDDLLFGITSDVEAFADQKVKKDGIVLFKKFDEGRNDFDGELKAKEIRPFISRNQLPLVTEFNQDTVAKIFTSDVKKHVLLISNKKGNDDILKKFREVAKDFKGEFLFIHLDPLVDDNLRVVEFLGLKNDSAPSLRIIDVANDMTKYKPTSEGADTAAIRKFVQDFISGVLEPQLLSQDIPKDWDSKPVKVLVSKNFKEVAFNKDKAVFVEFYAPWCDHCQKLEPIWNKLGEAYKDNDRIIIAKLDATANEVEGFNIRDYPTVKYFPRGSDKVIDYTGERTLEGFKEFLDSFDKEGARPQEEKKKDEKEEAKKKKPVKGKEEL